MKKYIDYYIGGFTGATVFNETKCISNLRKAIPRLNYLKMQNLAHISDTKSKICELLSKGKEIEASIHCSSLINDQRHLTCMELAPTLILNIQSRIDYISKHGVPKDMHVTVASLMLVAERLGIDELMEVRK